MDACSVAVGGDPNLAELGCGGSGPEENQFAAGVEDCQSAVAGARDRPRAGFDLSADRFAGAAIADRSSVDPIVVASARRRVAVAEKAPALIA